MVQDFKGWLGFSFDIFGGENSEKMGRKELQQLALLHNLAQRKKVQDVAVLKWIADKTNQFTSQIQ